MGLHLKINEIIHVLFLAGKYEHKVKAIIICADVNMKLLHFTQSGKTAPKITSK